MCSRCRLKSPQHRAHWTCILVPQLACLCTVPDMVFVHVASISLFSELEANVQDSVGRQMGLRLLMKFAGKPCSCLLSKHDLVYLPSLTYIHPVLPAVQYQEKQFLLLSPLGVDALYHAKHSVENT